MLLKRTVTLAQIRDIAALLSDISKEKNILVTGSADFSHYLSASEAKQRDEESRDAILSSDFEKIKQMTNDNIDSPETLLTVLSFTEKQGNKAEILAHASAAEYLKLPTLTNCTTYFVLGSGKKDT